METNPGERVDAQIFRLLRAVRDWGTVSRAAQELKLSYRHAWGLIERAGVALGEPLVIMERGRGARLSALGARLLSAHERAENRLRAQLTAIADELEQALHPAGRAGRATGRLAVRASHDLALARLRDLLFQRTGHILELEFCGSLQSVEALGRGQCQMAGFHWMDPIDGAAAAAIARHLKPRSHLALHFAWRQQGLMVRAGNPKRIRGLADLTRPEVKFINRQRASGTRLLLDRLLSQAGIAPTAIAGYEEEEFTHLAVAASVAGGLADAGFGIQAAAHQLGLHFVPLVRERYLLAMTRQTFRSPALQALVALLRSPEFEAKAGDLVGYDFSRAGEPVPLPGTSGSTRDRAGKMLR